MGSRVKKEEIGNFFFANTFNAGGSWTLRRWRASNNGGRKKGSSVTIRSLIRFVPRERKEGTSVTSITRILLMQVRSSVDTKKARQVK